MKTRLRVSFSPRGRGGMTSFIGLSDVDELSLHHGEDLLLINCQGRHAEASQAVLESHLILQTSEELAESKGVDQVEGSQFTRLCESVKWLHGAVHLGHESASQLVSNLLALEVPQVLLRGKKLDSVQVHVRDYVLDDVTGDVSVSAVDLLVDHVSIDPSGWHLRLLVNLLLDVAASPVVPQVRVFAGTRGEAEEREVKDSGLGNVGHLLGEVVPLGSAVERQHEELISRLRGEGLSTDLIALPDDAGG